MSLKHFLKGEFEGTEFLEALTEMTEAADRAAAVLGATFVDNQLRILLTRKMVKLSTEDKERLFDGMSPLATFSARIRVGYAFGCFGPITRHDLDVMREVRNAFAHSKKVITFDLPPVTKVVQRFRCVDSMHSELKARELFILAVKCLTLHLSASGAGHRGVTSLD